MENAPHLRSIPENQIPPHIQEPRRVACLSPRRLCKRKFLFFVPYKRRGDQLNQSTAYVHSWRAVRIVLPKVQEMKTGEQQTNNL